MEPQAKQQPQQQQRISIENVENQLVRMIMELGNNIRMLATENEQLKTRLREIEKPEK